MQVVPNLLIIPAGLIIGILVAAPVGPVNVLCIQRAIHRGFWGGVAAGLGAVLGDGLIAFSAAMGVKAVSGAVAYYRAPIQIIGGLALLAFGAKLYFTTPPLDAGEENSGYHGSFADHLWDVPKTFFLTITNPGAVLGLFAIFGGVSTFVEVKTTVDSLTLVACVMVGSFGWWVGLSHLITRIRHKINLERLGQINQFAGIALIAFGVLLIGEIGWKMATGLG